MIETGRLSISLRIVEPVVEKNKIEVIDGITYVVGYMIVNKTYSLPADYVPAGGANYESDEEWIINGETNEIKKSDDKKN